LLEDEQGDSQTDAGCYKLDASKLMTRAKGMGTGDPAYSTNTIGRSESSLRGQQVGHYTLIRQL
jgi:hypothetical protein